jgi:VWFA-related protein
MNRSQGRERELLVASCAAFCRVVCLRVASRASVARSAGAACWAAGRGARVLLLLVAAAASAQDVPRFAAEARVVVIDVHATDRDGRPLDDLRPSELEVLENGRACEIRSFRLIRTTGRQEPVVESDPAATTNAPAPSSSSPARANLIVLLFDRLPVESAPLVLRGALDFLLRDPPRDTWYAVFQVGGRRFLEPFTADLTVVRKAVEAATAPQPLAEVAAGSLAVENDALHTAAGLDTLYALEGVARALRGIEGRKSILYFGEGWQLPLSMRPDYEQAISAATRANVTVHTVDARGLTVGKPVPAAPLDVVAGAFVAERRGGPFGGAMSPERLSGGTGTPAERLAGPNLEELADDTGGRAIANTNDLGAGLVGVREDERQYYEIVYAPAAQENDGGFRRISVRVSRPGVTIRTRKGYFAAEDDARAPSLDEPPLRDALSAEAFDPQAPAADPSLVPVLERAARYVEAYEESFRNVVAEEAYSQSMVVGPRLAPPMGPVGLLRGFQRTRKTRADLVFVRLAGDDVPWSLFRDVFEVDGKRVRERDRRLEQLFRNPSPSARDQAHRIVEESARYNIGGAARTINVPTLPLVFLHPRNQSRFSFSRGGQHWISGVQALEVRFEEVAGPTVVTTSSGEALPARGTFWIDSSRGAVLKSEVVFRFEPSLAEASIETEYELQPGLGMWVPSQMKERYRNLPHASRSIFGAPTEATARYSNFRQFRVTVESGNARLPAAP